MLPRQEAGMFWCHFLNTGTIAGYKNTGPSINETPGDIDQLGIQYNGHLHTLIKSLPIQIVGLCTSPVLRMQKAHPTVPQLYSLEQKSMPACIKGTICSPLEHT